MTKLKIYFFSYLFFVASSTIIGQTKYINDSTYFQKISTLYFLRDTTLYESQFIDTSIIHFQNSIPFYFNGQINTAQPDYLLQNIDDIIGSKVSNIYHPDILTENQATVYRTKGFYSQINGITGSKDEQHFMAYFTSPIQAKHQINFYLRRSTNKGFYQNQQATTTNFFTDYHLFGEKRISMNASILLNYIKQQENGGIQNDTLSYRELFLDKTLIPINLSNAKKNIRHHSFQYHFYYSLNRFPSNQHTLSFSLLANQKLFQYQDDQPMSGYYNSIFLDTLKTNDSLHSIKLDVPISYIFKFKNSVTQVAYQYQWNNIYLFVDTIMQNHIIQGETNIRFKLFNIISGIQSVQANYIFHGTHKNNWKAEISSELTYKKIIFKLLIKNIYQSPTFQENYWYSNHFIWNNHFQNISKQILSTTLKYSSFVSLNYSFFNMKDFIFFLDHYPQQYKKNLIIHQFKTEIDKVFFKHLGINLNYYYQWKNTNIIALPKHFIKTDIYYQGRWFHKNLLVNTGIQYISALTYFDTYQYNPATGVYSIMSNYFQAGNYPQIGLYFSGRIKPVNFFIRMDNILSSIYSQPYYFIPHYMMPDRTFRMGISWSFFD